MTEIVNLSINKQPLGQIALHHAFSVQVKGDGVQANANGRKIIPTGTPLTGDFEDPNSVFTISNDGNAKGITEYPVDVTNGNANVALIDSGYIDLNKITDVTISDAAKKAIAPKVVFYRPTNKY